MKWLLVFLMVIAMISVVAATDSSSNWNAPPSNATGGGCINCTYNTYTNMTGGNLSIPTRIGADDGTNIYGLSLDTMDLTGFGLGKYSMITGYSNGAGIGNGFFDIEGGLAIGNTVTPSMFGNSIVFVDWGTISLISLAPDWNYDGAGHDRLVTDTGFSINGPLDLIGDLNIGSGAQIVIPGTSKINFTGQNGFDSFMYDVWDGENYAPRVYDSAGHSFGFSSNKFTVSNDAEFHGVTSFGSSSQASIQDFQTTGAWLDMPAVIAPMGASGIGDGGAGHNLWIGHAGQNTDWFGDSIGGDLCYKNEDGRLLFGTSTMNAEMIIDADNVTFYTPVKSYANITTSNSIEADDSILTGDLNVNNNATIQEASIYNLHVHNISGFSPIYVMDNIVSGNNITAEHLYGDISSATGFPAGAVYFSGTSNIYIYNNSGVISFNESKNNLTNYPRYSNPSSFIISNSNATLNNMTITNGLQLQGNTTQTFWNNSNNIRTDANGTQIQISINDSNRLNITRTGIRVFGTIVASSTITATGYSGGTGSFTSVSGTGALSGFTTGGFSSLINQATNGISNTTTDGIKLINNQLLNLTNRYQKSPAIELVGRAWDNGTMNETSQQIPFNFTCQVVPQANSTLWPSRTNAVYTCGFATNSSARTDMFNITSEGNVSFFSLEGTNSTAACVNPAGIFYRC